jgi:hypothetical protein
MPGADRVFKACRRSILMSPFNSIYVTDEDCEGRQQNHKVTLLNFSEHEKPLVSRLFSAEVLFYYNFQAQSLHCL